MTFLCKKLNSRKKWRVQTLQSPLLLKRKVVKAAKSDLTNPTSYILYVFFGLLIFSVKIVVTIFIILIIFFCFVEHYRRGLYGCATYFMFSNGKKRS